MDYNPTVFSITYSIHLRDKIKEMNPLIGGDNMNNLVEIFEEIDYHLMNDIKPSKFFNSILSEQEYRDSYPLKILIDLRKVEQNPVHHPEGNVYNHTMEVVDNAAQIKDLSQDQRVFMWAAFLHDVGKITTTRVRKGRITAYDHDKQGESIAKNFLETFMEDSAFINKVVKLVRWHMQPLFVSKGLPFAKVEQMADETSIAEVALLSLCDRMGRGDLSRKKEKIELLVVMKFLSNCQEKNDNKEETSQIEKVMDYLTNRINKM